MMNRTRLVVGGIVVATVAAAVVVAVLGPGPEPTVVETPEAAFEAALARIRAGDFDGVWGLLSEKMRASWSKDIRDQQMIATDVGPNRDTAEQYLQTQFGFGCDRFVALTPRELYAAFLKRNAEMVLGYRITGKSQINGDKADVRVQVRPDEPVAKWSYVLIDGRWYLDETEKFRAK